MPADSARPDALVAWLGAVQSQDYPGAKWGLGQRIKGATDIALDKAFNEGRILRTHVMRPTWHFVTPADIRWMLQLTAPRINAGSASYYRKNELDDDVFKKSRVLLERLLRDGRSLTRGDIRTALRKAGIECSPMRLGLLMMRLELDAIVCSGPLRGKQFTYALLEERAPAAKLLTRDEGLALLTARYFASHGPATIRDFVWWSGLTVRDAKAGIAMVSPALSSESIDGITYWFRPSRVPPEPKPAPIHLLPAYDEYLIAYKDRDVAVDDVRAKAGTFDPYAYFLMIDGRLRGTWRRTIGAKSATITVRPFRPLTRQEQRALIAEADRYGRFINVEVAVSVVTSR
jgi:Winged helix DNA-binding domain